MEVMCHYFGLRRAAGKEGYWGPAKRLLLADPKLFDKLTDYDKDNVKAAVIDLVRPYMERDDFSPERIGQVSKGCHAFCLWCRAMYAYATALGATTRVAEPLLAFPGELFL